MREAVGKSFGIRFRVVLEWLFLIFYLVLGELQKFLGLLYFFIRIFLRKGRPVLSRQMFMIFLSLHDFVEVRAFSFVSNPDSHNFSSGKDMNSSCFFSVACDFFVFICNDSSIVISS